MVPDDRPGFTEFAARVRAGGGRQTGELALFPQDGRHAQRHVHIEGIASEAGGSFRVVLLDITEQRQLKETICAMANNP